MMLSSLRTHFSKHFLRYRPVVEVFIHKNNIVHNFNTYSKAYPKTAIAPVLKSNAYGHGLVEVAKIIEPLNPPYLVVDSIFEALRIRHAKVKTPILIIGYTFPENIVGSRIPNTDFGVTAIETLEYLAHHLKKPRNIHLKFDTGMHRQGIDPVDLKKASALVSSNKNIVVSGIFSHFADADNMDTKFTQAQITTWNSLVKECRALFPTAKHFHLAATFGAAFSEQIDANLIRLGIGLYGCSTSPHQKNLDQLPALQLNTIVTSIRTVPAGDGVGYGVTATTTKESKLATIPVGYFEGLDRRLSNVGSIVINGLPAPIFGRVSMNISTIDCSNISNLKVGDSVEVIGVNSQVNNSIVSMAQLANTVPYELLVHVPPHLRRIVV